MKATSKGLVLTSKRKLLTLAVASCFAGELAYANPTGPSVAQGQATIASQGNVLTVTNTPGTVINWQSFSVASQEITRFLQQSAASTVLNRVVGVNPSTILGTLQSNGRVFLINPNGITIGQGATIDVAGFLASTLNLSDADFLAGRYRFTQSTGTGSVVNQGTINTSTGGMVYLVGQNVENQGIIKSPKGEILLAAGKSIELVDAGTPEIRVQITAPDNQVLNLGQLLASGGRIGMYGGLVRHAGVANANTAVVGENGKIVFKAVKDVKLETGSTTTASGPTAGSIKVEAETGKASIAGTVEANATAGRGGNIDVSGQQGVTVESTGRVSANGAEGGSVALSSSAGPVQVAGQVSANASAGRGGQVAVAAATQSTISSGAVVTVNGPQGGGTVGIKAVDSVTVETGSAIQANGASGGTVTVDAEQGSAVIGGAIEATGSEAQGGTIQVAALSDVTLSDTSILAASGRRGGEARIEAREGTTLGSGVIDVSGKDGPGGKVQLLGPQVALYREATINVSGKTGGGIALVGGDYQGKNPDVPNAQRTYVGPDVLITADAIETGNGGKVIIWADNDTRSLGSITARGGAQSGDGGFIETSGKHYLEVEIPADASAPNGKAGVWLLDPANVEIVAAGANTNIDTAAGTYSPFEAAIAANSAKIGNAVINAALDAGTNVVIDTVSAGNTEAGDVTVNAAITLSSGTPRNVSLSLNADGSVFVNSAISATGASNVLNVNLGQSGVTTGSVTFGGGGSVTTQGGNVSVFAGTTVTLGAITTGAGTLGVTAAGDITQIGSLKIGGATTLTSKTNAITATLTTAGNDFGTVTLASPTGSFSTVSVTDTVDAMSVGGSATTLNASAKGALTLTGGTYTTLNATSQNSSVGQSGALTANTLLVSATSTSTLNDPTNDVVTVAAAITGLSQGFIYKDANAVDIGTVGATNGITTNKGDVSVTTVNGAISVSKSINAGGTTGGNITLTTAETAEATNAALTFAAGGSISGKAVTLNSADGITQNTSAVITATTLEVLAATDTGATGVDETVSLQGSNLVGTLAAKRNTATAGVDLTFNYKNAQNLIIGTAGGTTGIVTGNGPIDVKVAGGTLDVNQTVNGGSVTLNSSGVMTIAAAGDIFASTGAVSLTASRIDTAGDVSTTDQNVTFNSPTTLQGDVTIGADAGNVTFSSTLDGPNALTVNSSGTTKFSGTVGNTTPLSKLTTDSAGGTTINTTVVKTSSDMTFNDPITLSANAALITTTGGNISFGSAINADDASVNDRTLTLNSGTGTISVSGTIGNLQPLAGLTVSNSNGATFTSAVDVTDATGTITISDTAATKTVAFQNNLVTDVFTAPNGGNAYNVSFLGGTTTVNSSATFSNTGTLQIGDQTADTTSITGGITHTAGPTILAGGITTGVVSLNATTIVSGQTATLNAGASDVTFNTTLDGPGGLVVNSGGNTIFTGVVGGIAPLNSLQTNAGGTTKVNGGSVTTDGAGGITFGDAVTFNGTTIFATNGSGSTGSNITFDQTATGPGGIADLTLNAGTTGNVTALGVVSGIRNLTVTADNVNMAGGIVHTVNNAVTFNSAGDVNYAQNGDLNIGLSNVAGAANITANNGSIITGGAGNGFTAGSIVLTATDGAGTDVGTITVGAGGITTTSASGSLTLKSADGMTINGPLVSNNRPIILMAGSAPGMASLGTPATNAGGAAPGSVQINAPIQGGTGDITIYSTGPVTQALSPTDAGVQTSNALTVRTYNDSAGAATITMDNDKLTGGVTCATGNAGTGNCATQITLETRQAGDTGTGSTTVFPGGFAASQISYKSISGTQIIGIGTASDVLLEADSWVLNAGAINGRNVNIVATGINGTPASGNIDVGIAIPTSFINNNQTGGSLNLRAARDINILQSGSIGTQGSRFDHNLVLAAGDDISIQGSIYLNGDLNLRANAVAGDLNGNTPLLTTGTVSISTPGTIPVEVIARNITVGDAARPVDAITLSAGTAGTGQSADAILRADNILRINTAGDLSMTGGTATASTPSATQTTADALLAGAAVNIVVGGDFTLTGGASTITAGAGVSQTAHANSKVEGAVSLRVMGNATLTGGTATAATGANTSTASASIVSSATLSPFIGGDLMVAGGTSLAQPVAGRTAVADASAEVKSGGDLILNVGHDLILTGGASVASTALGGTSATADSGASLAATGIKDIHVAHDFTINGGSAATTGARATATSIAGLDAGSAPSASVTLNVNTGGDLQLLGGTEIGNALASAAILSAGEIKLFINGPTGLSLGGGSGSNLFQLVGPTLISLQGRSYPITIQGNFDTNSGLARGDAFIISGAPPLNLDSLLAAFLRTTDCVTFSGGSCTVPGTSTRAAETTKTQAGAGVCK